MDRKCRAVRENDGGGSTTERREQGVDIRTEQGQKIFATLDFFIITRDYCDIIGKR